MTKKTRSHQLLDGCVTAWHLHAKPPSHEHSEPFNPELLDGCGHAWLPETCIASLKSDARWQRKVSKAKPRRPLVCSRLMLCLPCRSRPAMTYQGA